MNGPGTAISVMVSLTTLVVEGDRAMSQKEAEAKAAKKDQPEAASPMIEFDRLTLPALDVRTLVADGFSSIACDGASMLGGHPAAEDAGHHRLQRQRTGGA